jgi:BirA family transcriptional regulator, biotin operon repressor / biotin---[acetyl-CoA-carboxylase] ligase
MRPTQEPERVSDSVESKRALSIQTVFEMKLDPRATEAGVRLVVHDVLGSTNAEALKLARDGERGALWVVAGRQTAGRGRRGRAWISEPGNLYASLLLTAPAPAVHWPQLSFVAALAIHDAVLDVAAGLKPRLAIKWPNDVLFDAAKIAGILIEGQSGQREEAAEEGAAAIGIGVNCTSHPPDTDHPATDLAAAGAAVSPDLLFRALSAKMLGRLAQWNRGEGFSTIRADWLARAVGVGETVRVRLADREITGRFEELDAAGALMLRLPDGGAATIAAGDVFVLTPSAGGER